MPESPIRHVSDTARWVAFHRAVESERSDALFHDPFARRLAGPEGEAIVRSMRFASAGWSVVTRTVLIDEIILRSIAEKGIQRVLNLAAGLDMRPYRMKLPSSLQWVEVDLPGIFAHKDSVLSGEKPVCRFERIVCDLADEGELQSLMNKLEADALPTLIVTEGLLIYLEEASVVRLAKALAAAPHNRFWLTDLMTPRLLRYLAKMFGKPMDKTGSPFRFAPEEGAKYFDKFGWQEREWYSLFVESFRIKRTMRFGWLFKFMGSLQSAEKREQDRRMGGLLLMERIGH